MSNRLNGLSDMDGYCLRTKLIENPNICFYYKGVEDGNTVYSALNVVVAFTLADALVLDEASAKRLCNRLNEDGKTLFEHGFTLFEIKRTNVGNIKDND